MSDGITEAIEGLVQFTNAYMAKAQAELKVTTDKITAGTFTANDAVDGMLRAGMLWVGGLAGAAVETMDAASTIAKWVGKRTLYTGPLKVGLAGPWSLAITTPLTNAQNQVLAAPSASVSIEPPGVQAGETDTFVVKAVVTQAGSGLYAGVVTATNAAGAKKDIVAKIQVG